MEVDRSHLKLCREEMFMELVKDNDRRVTLLRDISSIKATLQSNHTLKGIIFSDYPGLGDIQGGTQIKLQTNIAMDINKMSGESSPEVAGRQKVIQTQLHSKTRAKLAKLQGVSQSVYSEINPRYLPEVLSLIGRSHGQGELYVALKSSVAGVISVVNRKQCIKQQLEYYAAKSTALNAELAEIEARERSAMEIETGDFRTNKRRRV